MASHRFFHVPNISQVWPSSVLISIFLGRDRHHYHFPGISFSTRACATHAFSISPIFLFKCAALISNNKSFQKRIWRSRYVHLILVFLYGMVAVDLYPEIISLEIMGCTRAYAKPRLRSLRTLYQCITITLYCASASPVPSAQISYLVSIFRPSNEQ